MNRRQILQLGGLAILTLAESACSFKVVGVSDLEKLFDQVQTKKKAELRRHIKGIQENMVTLKTHTEYIVNYEGRPKINARTMYGEGLIYGDYVLTANHVIEFTEKTIRNYAKEYFGQEFNPDKFIFIKIDENTLLDGEIVNEKLNYPKKEIGIILYKGPKKSDYVVKLGDSDKLDLIDELYVLGRPNSEYPVVKGGIIGSEKEKNIYDIMKGEIITNHRVVPGDSGSPLVNQHGEVVGIVSMIREGSHTISVPINAYKEAIAEYEESQKK